MNNQTKDKWNLRYNACLDNFPEAVEVISQNQHLLPDQGTALDLACGRGAIALCLAENGLETTAWDISSSALEQLSLQASERNLSIHTVTKDISEQPPEKNTFDVIVVSRFLDRNLMVHIKNSIRPGGLIFYQTYTKDKVNESGPKNPDFLLNENELLKTFSDWRIIVYREESTIGKIDKGFRNQAMLIAQKP
ncbi:MAG: methyltransferase domain-containing protein [Proteobacteria bacterium]|nr:methyltransferase domain-containing protein [Pseudomonadota bacterium]NOG60221.1 methyltransferase domain-containing protein [Pseudomonadota bacterium]